jgi:hypothetical protein
MIMKKLFLLAICTWQFAAQAQELSKPLNESGNCPEGYCAGFFIEIENFNFHKPRTECTRGFGFCLRMSVGATCIPCISKTAASSKTTGVTGFLMDGMAVLHISKNIKNAIADDETEFALFDIEDKSVEIKYPGGSSVYLKGGSYPVAKESDEFIIRIPVE